MTYRANQHDALAHRENQFGSGVTALQEKNAFARTLKRSRLLRHMERLNGQITDVEEYLRKIQEKLNQSHLPRHEQRELFKKQYASELADAGFSVQSACVLDQLEKYHGDVNRV
jgi:hypothetical protein